MITLLYSWVYVTAIKHDMADDFSPLLLLLTGVLDILMVLAISLAVR